MSLDVYFALFFFFFGWSIYLHLSQENTVYYRIAMSLETSIISSPT